MSSGKSEPKMKRFPCINEIVINNSHLENSFKEEEIKLETEQIDVQRNDAELEEECYNIEVGDENMPVDKIREDIKEEAELKYESCQKPSLENEKEEIRTEKEPWEAIADLTLTIS